ncbi:DUF4847 family protein [Bacteroides sp. UBA939]|uniref:DUF4847 family protein n=1 Tax=Bacteroides sp. UBA939 TaxID=1946092 RepID=UPI0025BEC5D6|nr:DUF4847 family protein [Bacteroides sp. UBA939]
MNRRIRNISYLLMVLSLFPILNGCNQEDDVIEIFTGKTWKLSRLTTENSSEPFLPNLWNNETDYNNSIEALNREGTFTLTFTGTEVNGEIIGTLAEATGIRATTSGTWHVDGKTRSLTISARVNGSETDPLARAFIAAIENVYKYEGDVNTLTLYYHEGQQTRIMGFTPL